MVAFESKNLIITIISCTTKVRTLTKFNLFVQKGELIHAPTGWCLDHGTEKFAVLNPCNSGPSQKWIFSEYLDLSKAPQN